MNTQLFNKPKDSLPGSHNIYHNAEMKIVTNEISFTKVYQFAMIPEVPEAGYSLVLATFLTAFMVNLSAIN